MKPCTVNSHLTTAEQETEKTEKSSSKYINNNKSSNRYTAMAADLNNQPHMYGIIIVLNLCAHSLFTYVFKICKILDTNRRVNNRLNYSYCNAKT